MKLLYMRYFQGETLKTGAQGNCLTRLTQYPPLSFSKLININQYQYCQHMEATVSCSWNLAVCLIQICSLYCTLFLLKTTVIPDQM